LPPSPDFRENFPAILLYLRDESAGCPCVLVPRAPNQQLQQNRRQVNSLLRQPVVHTPAISLLYFRGDDSSRFKLLETVRQNVGRDAFTRFLKLSESSEAANHQIADNQQ
jgi:hypothetical protein